MPIELSRRVARFNKRVNNPIQRQYAWLLPPWVMIVHTGRKSGRVYRTPVNAFKRGDVLAVAMLYGERTDWAQNLLAAGGGHVVRGGRTYPLSDVRIVDPDTARGQGASARVLPLGRASGRVLVGRLGEAAAGFGRGPGIGSAP